MKRANTGFTLVELMIALVVGILILSIGIPAFTNLMSGNRATANANNFIGALRLARSEAVKRGEGVTVCASNSTYSGCDSNNWSNGWLVFTDPDNDRAYTAGTDELLRVWTTPEGGVVFSGTAPNSIRFLASGELSGSVNDFSFKDSHCTGNQAKTISVSKLGRAEITPSACF